MSGLPHGIGDAEYGGTRAGEAVEWPTIGQGDREFAHVSVRLTAWHRGYYDGRRVLGWRRLPEADPVDARHVKLHCAAALKVIAPKIKATRLSADSLEKTYCAAYEEGFKHAYAGGIAFQ